MRHVIRSCYPSLFSKEKIRHSDRQADRKAIRGFARGDLLSHIARYTGMDIDLLELTREQIDEERERDMLIELENTIDTKADEARLKCGINALLDRTDDQTYYAGKADGLNDAWKIIDKILNPEIY